MRYNTETSDTSDSIQQFRTKCIWHCRHRILAGLWLGFIRWYIVRCVGWIQEYRGGDVPRGAHHSGDQRRGSCSTRRAAAARALPEAVPTLTSRGGDLASRLAGDQSAAFFRPPPSPNPPHVDRHLMEGIPKASMWVCQQPSFSQYPFLLQLEAHPPSPRVVKKRPGFCRWTRGFWRATASKCSRCLWFEKEINGGKYLFLNVYYRQCQ